MLLVETYQEIPTAFIILNTSSHHFLYLPDHLPSCHVLPYQPPSLKHTRCIRPFTPAVLVLWAVLHLNATFATYLPLLAHHHRPSYLPSALLSQI